MALSLLTKRIAATTAYPALAAMRPTVAVSRLAVVRAVERHQYSTPSGTSEPPAKKSSVLDSLPGNSLATKAGFITAGTALATVLISKEIYILNEETLVLVASGGLLTVVLKYLREPFTSMANDHIQRIKLVLNTARNDHKTAVQQRIDEVGQMKDLVGLTETLFELSRETAKMESEAFQLKQKVAVANEVKSILGSWVRHEANVREREQKELASYLMQKIQKDLEDPKVQQAILDQAVLDVQSVAKSA